MWQGHYQLRPSDFDALGHVMAAAYLRIFVEIRSDWMIRGLGTTHPSAVLRAQAIDYLREIRADAPSVTVELEISRIGTSSFELAERMVTPAGVHATSKATLLMWDMDARRPRPVQPDERAFLDKHLA